MSDKWNWIVNKVVGAGMLLVSIPFLAHAQVGALLQPVQILSGALFAGGGLWLVARREKKLPAAELDVQQRLQQLTEGMASTQGEIVAMQERLERLTEERDFMRQLAAGNRASGSSPASPSPGSTAG